MTTSFSIFEYCYRDASNYKAFDNLLLTGAATPGDVQELQDTLIEGEWFIAEQVGIPTLFHRLFAYSGGYPTIDDHEWHEFVRVREATTTEIAELPTSGSVGELLSRFRIAKTSAWRHPGFGVYSGIGS